MKNKFIYITKDIITPSYNIENLSVGTVVSEENNNCLIEFLKMEGLYKVSKDVIEYFDPIETGDAFSHKICNICNRILPTDNFENNQIGKGNRILKRPTCKDCRKTIDGIHMSSKVIKEWSAIKPDMEIFTCPICHKRFIAGVTCKVVLDHDHNTGKPRAWVCNSCNTAIGQFRDNIEILEDVIRYLKSKND